MFEKPGPFFFGRSSTRELDTLKEPMKRVLTRAIEVYDFSIIEGSRAIETQIKYVRQGVSKTIDSRHIPRDEEGDYLPEGWERQPISYRFRLARILGPNRATRPRSETRKSGGFTSCRVSSTR